MLEPQRSTDGVTEAVHADVGIIGAGPAGLAAALRLGQLGINRVVIVDRQEFPRDKTCGSAISPKGCALLETLGLHGAVARESYAVNGLRLVTPRGHDVSVSSSQNVALVCHRYTLDHLLLQRAQQLGARFIGRFDASHLLQRGDRVVGFRSADGRVVRAAHTLVADGAHSRFARERGRRRLIQAIMGWWDNVPFQPHRVEMIFDDLVSPYYGWLFPESPTRVNIGICYQDDQLMENGRELFQKFLDKHFASRLSGARQVGRWKGHPISYEVQPRYLTSPGRIVIGEAGRMTHPATAEGIYQGMRSGVLAAQALYEILKRGTEPERALRDFERACCEAFTMSFRCASLWRSFVKSGALDVVAKTLNRPVASRLLARYMAMM